MVSNLVLVFGSWCFTAERSLAANTMQKYDGEIALYEFFQEYFQKTFEIYRNLLKSTCLQTICFKFFRSVR
jgi:hypothetical protein